MPQPFQQHRAQKVERPWPFKRRFVTIQLLALPTGQLIPQRLIWEDGRSWDIDKVIDIRPQAARKSGGFGTRYLVKISGKERELYQDNHQRWFVEAPASFQVDR